MPIKELFKDHKKSIRLGISILLGLWGIKKARQSLLAYKMTQISLKKREQCHQQLKEYRENYHQPCTLSLELQTQILNSNIKQIQTLLYERKITVRQLLLLFIDRVLQKACHNNLNLITEINFIQALEQADDQDNEINKDREVINKYPLFGIPVSIKESLLMQGFDSTVGVAANCFKPSIEDGTQAAQIRKAGGIIFVRTNIPQTLMAFESTNPIFGRSLNPWNTARAVGGSSGGEGGMAAARCSVIGLGTDLGGSIRIPSAFCGVYGLKPCTQRIPDQGERRISQAAYGVMQMRTSRGPIGRCVDDLVVLTKVLFDKQIYSQLPQGIKDPYFQNRELRNLPIKEKLRIGYFDIFDGLVPANCMRRAVKEACQALESKGHEIIKFDIDPQIQHQIALSFMKVQTADGGMKHFSALQGQDYIKEHEILVQASKTPLFIKKYILGPILKLFGQETLLKFNECGKVDVYRFLNNTGNSKQVNIQFLQFMQDQNIDALICPGFALPAIKHGSSRKLGLAAIYTWIFNVLDLPAGSLPITQVQDGDDLLIQGKENTSDFIYKTMKDNMIGSVGLPINVQVVSYPNQEEMVLKVMKEIEEVVQFNQKYPYPE